MSFDGQTWAWKQACPTPNSRFVLLYLAMRADDDTGYCYPGQKTIAKATGLSERTVRDAMNALDDAGLIVRRPRYSGRMRTSDDIWVRFTELTIFAGRTADSAGTEFPVELAPEPAAAPKRQKRSPVAAPVAGEQVREPIRGNQSESSLRSESSARADLAADPDLADDTYGDDEEIVQVVEEVLDPVEQAVAAYNETCEETGWPPAKKIGHSRRKAIAARLAEHGLEGWMEALGKAVRSPLCRGQAGRTTWRFSIDFMGQESSFQKLIEGVYDGSPGRSGGRVSMGTVHAAMRRLEADEEADYDPRF